MRPGPERRESRRSFRLSRTGLSRCHSANYVSVLRFHILPSGGNNILHPSPSQREGKDQVQYYRIANRVKAAANHPPLTIPRTSGRLLALRDSSEAAAIQSTQATPKLQRYNYGRPLLPSPSGITNHADPFTFTKDLLHAMTSMIAQTGPIPKVFQWGRTCSVWSNDKLRLAYWISWRICGP